MPLKAYAWVAVSSLVAMTMFGAGMTGRAAVAQGPSPTYNADVAPIVFANCVGCHRPNNIAPMSLMTYEQTKAYGKRLREVVSTREMPPWYADPRFGQFKNVRGLTDAQIQTITSWVDGGAPQGDGTPPPPPKFPDTAWDPRMNRDPDEILELPFGEYELPARGEVPTFTVWMKLPLREDRFVQAIQLKPSLPNVVHHSSLALASLPEGTRIGRGEVFAGGPVLAGVPLYSDGRPFRATSGEEFGRPIMFYVPGGGFLRFDDGLAKRFGQQDYLAWGLHLISAGRVEKVRVQLGVWYARRDPHHEVYTWTVNETLLFDGKEVKPDARGVRRIPNIPPGVDNLPVTGILKITDDITIYSLWPHMHYRGKDMTFVVTEPNGKQTTLLSVPHYNPHWQLTYELAKPLRVKRGSTITAYGHYDNSAGNPHNPDPTAEVTFGPQGTDEMYIPFLEVSVDKEDRRFQRSF